MSLDRLLWFVGGLAVGAWIVGPAVARLARRIGPRKNPAE